MDEGRENFASRLGFVLAAAGSAIGLGNVWRFPYVAGENGGGAFLLIYLVFVFSLGLGVMLAEFAVGRAGRRNPVGAYRALGGRTWAPAGYLGVAAGVVILSFYSVVGGWTMAYTLKALTGGLAGGDPDALGAAFGAFIAEPWGVLAFHGLFMAATIGVVAGGVRGGIERTARLLMPVLAVLAVVLAVRAVTLPGAAQGLAFFLVPDFSKVTWGTVNAALGQAFFSLSLGMGALLTYASYLGRDVHLPRTALQVTTMDTAFAVIAGLMVLPAVFAFGFDPMAGPGLVFITLPAVFAKMPLGAVFAALFFALLAIAALTSAVSLLETAAAYLVDEHRVGRRRASVAMGVLIWLLGVPSALSLGPWKDVTVAGKGFLDLMDYVTSNVMLPLGGVVIALFVGWRISERAAAEAAGGQGFPLVRAWLFLCRYVAPAAIAWVLVSGL